MKYTVVLGCPRSGTTFLMSVLNTLPGVACVNGTLLSTSVPHVLNRDLTAEVRHALAVGFRRNIEDYLAGQYHSRFKALEKWRSTRALSTLRQVVRRGPRQRPHRFIYKETFLSFAPGFVRDSLPDAKIIYLYHDGRDCANSLVASYDVLTDEALTHFESTEMRLGRKYDHRYVPWWVAAGEDRAFIESVPYVRAIWMWKEMVRRCYEQFGPPSENSRDNVLQVAYEDLMCAPVQEGERLLEFLDEPVRAPWQKRVREAHTRSIGKYARRNREEVAVGEHIAQRELELLDYL